MLRFLLCLSMLTYELGACTGITLQSEDGSNFYARTLEFGVGEIEFNVIMVPRNTKYVGSTPDGKAGKKWTNKYAFVGANIYDSPYLADGVNEKGLAAGIFYFPGYAKYDTYNQKNASFTIAEWELITWVLSRFATVQEAIDHLHQVDVVAVKLDKLGLAPPVHYILHDESGDCVVIEYAEDGLHIYDNPLGVVTNSPGFEWQATNLGNYVNLSATSPKPIDLGGKEFDGFGQGTGMVGLPGDFTPPSRFVKATALSKTVLKPKTSKEAVQLAFHVLDSFDIPIGAVRSQQGGKTVYDHTQFTSCTDLKNKKFYFTTYGNRCPRVVSLDQFDLDAPGIKIVTMQQEEKVQDLSDQLKPMM